MAQLRNETNVANGEIILDESIVINQPAEAIQELSEISFVAGGNAQVEAQEIDLLTLNIGNSFSIKPEEVYTDANLDLIVGKIAAAMNTAANLHFKGSTFLEPCEVENVKSILDTEKCDIATKNKFKKELTDFQEQIKTNYVQQIKTYKEQQLYCETHIERLEATKKQIVMDRLAKMSWPYDEKTRAYDRKIDTLKIQVERIKQKTAELESMRPAAKEKDILIFQHQLKEKFTT